MGEIITTVEKMEEMINLTKRGKSPLAAALLEDEATRKNAEEIARKHIIDAEIREREMPAWMWNVLFFLLGMLFAMSEPAIFNFIWDMVEIYHGRM